MTDPTATNSMADAIAEMAASSTTAEDVTKMDPAVEAAQCMIQGKRHLLVHDYASAVESLQEACQLLDAKYGVSSDESGDAYLCYGIALLELARQETGALDGVVHAKIHVPSESEDEEEEDDDEAEEEEEPKEDEKSVIPPPEATAIDGACSSKTIAEEDIEVSDSENAAKIALENGVEEPSSSAAVDNNDQPGPSKPSTSGEGAMEGEEEEDDGEASNMEVSWEVLCLARDVFRRQLQSNHNVKPKLAEALQNLGEIAIEWENNSAALELLQESLSLRKESLAEDDRLIAETYYHIGIAMSFNNEVESANDCFRSAISVIEQRIENQKKFIAAADVEDETKFAVERELYDLESLLPEMKLKIEDSQDQMGANEGLKEQVTEMLEEKLLAAKKKEVQAKPVTNVSHLVKRKRTNSGDPTTPKKVCVDSSQASLKPTES